MDYREVKRCTESEWASGYRGLVLCTPLGYPAAIGDTNAAECQVYNSRYGLQSVPVDRIHKSVSLAIQQCEELNGGT